MMADHTITVFGSTVTSFFIVSCPHYTPYLVLVQTVISSSVSSCPVSSAGPNTLLRLSRSTRRNLAADVLYQSNTGVDLLSPHEAVDDEVDGAVEDEEEVLDGGETEHPAGVGCFDM